MVFIFDRKTYVQWGATLAAFLLMFEVGIEMGWPSPNFLRFATKDSPIQLTSDEISWVIAASGIGGAIGAILFSIGLEFFGGRRIILITLIAIGISWIFLIIANSAVWIYIARLIVGTTYSGAYCSFSIYLGEVVPSKIRGTVMSIVCMGGLLGVLVGTITETYIASMKISSLVYLVICVIAILLTVWLKDSPYYLAKKGHFEKAEQSLTFYFAECNVEQELKAIKGFVKNDNGKLKQLQIPVIRKSVLVIFILFGLPIISGSINIVSYMATIMQSAKLNIIEPEKFVIYANSVNVLVLFMTMRLSDKFGRKTTLIFSSIGTSIGMVCLGLHFYLLKKNFDEQSLQWLPIFSILFFTITYAVGYAPVPSTVLSELFPENIKSLAAFFATLSTSMFCFIVSKSFQPLVNTFGEEYVFWLHAVLSLLTIPCTLFLLPETKGKTFQQIQSELMKSRMKR